MRPNFLHEVLNHFPLVVKRPNLTLLALDVEGLGCPFGATGAGTTATPAILAHAVFSSGAASASALTAESAAAFFAAFLSAIILA